MVLYFGYVKVGNNALTEVLSIRDAINSPKAKNVKSTGHVMTVNHRRAQGRVTEGVVIGRFWTAHHHRWCIAVVVVVRIVRVVGV